MSTVPKSLAIPPAVRALYPIREARQLLGGWSNSFFYEQVAKGVVRLVKVGRRSFVSAEEIARIARGEAV